MIMPWGKHQGKEIEDIDSGYLRWLFKNCDDDEIAEEAESEYDHREENGTHFWEER